MVSGDLSEEGLLIKHRITPNRILTNIPLTRVIQDLERYQSLAINLGASGAVIISSDEIIIDERVRAKCMFPKCSHYGTNINCPPYVPDLNFIKKVICNYQYAILFCIKSETEYFIKGNNYLKFSGTKNPQGFS